MVLSPSSAKKKAIMTVINGPNRLSGVFSSFADSGLSSQIPNTTNANPATMFIQNTGRSLPTPTPSPTEIKLISALSNRNTRQNNAAPITRSKCQRHELCLVAHLRKKYVNQRRPKCCQNHSSEKQETRPCQYQACDSVMGRFYNCQCQSTN